MLRSMGFRARAGWRPCTSLLLFCGLAVFGGATDTEAAIRNWKPFTVDANWSNPANWEEGIAPVNGDELRFPTPGVSPATVNNDIANLTVYIIRTSGIYTVTGQPFTLANGMSGTGKVTYDVHITLGGDQAWTVHGLDVVVNGGFAFNGSTLTTASAKIPGTITVPGVVSGHGKLIVGNSRFDLLNANTFTGPIFGTVGVGHPSALGVGDGTLANGTIGGVTFLAPVVLAGERFEFASIGWAISQAGGGTFTGPIRLTGEVVHLAFTDTVNLRGALELAGSSTSLLPFVESSNGLDITGVDLSISLPEAFRASIGQVFTIVDMYLDNQLVGTFNGLPEGATFTTGGVRFQISYLGGVSANDVVLTVVGVDHQYYLSEGATGSFFSTDVLIANPNSTAAPVTVTFLKSAGASVAVSDTLPAFSRRTIRVNDVAGMEDASFSTIVRSNDGLPIVVERTMSWDQTGYGAHTEKAISGPSKTWLFAEGSQGFFSTYVLLTNPHASANSATVRYLIEDAPSITRSYSLDPESRYTVDIGADADLRGKTFGMDVTFDQPGIAERAMYFGTSPLWTGGHDSVGVTAPSTTWFLAEGATGTFFETFVLLANPHAIDVPAAVDYNTPAGAWIRTTKTIPANGRLTINIEQEDPALASTPVSTTVTTHLPIVVERSQYWPDPAPQWYEAHNSFGLTALGKKWGLAEGRVGGAGNAQTYILISCPTQASIKVTFLRETGIPVQKTFNVGAGRYNITVGGEQVPEITNERFGVLIESTNDIAVERALYWDAGNVIWAAGSNATATRLP
jgi:hypothetical protein